MEENETCLYVDRVELRHIIWHFLVKLESKNENQKIGNAKFGSNVEDAICETYSFWEKIIGSPKEQE